MSLKAITPHLNARELEVVKRASLTADQVLENMNALNEELEESFEIEEAFKLNKVENINPQAEEIGDDMFDDDFDAEYEAEMAKLREKKERRDAALKAEQEKQKIEEKVEVPAEPVDQRAFVETEIKRLLKASKDAPSEKDIENWKRQLGKNAVFALGLGEGNIYVFTYLRRDQWIKIRELVQATAEAGSGQGVQDPDRVLKEKVLQRAVIWPKLTLEFFHNSPAGVVDTLFNAVLLQSYFLEPAQAAALTITL